MASAVVEDDVLRLLRMLGVVAVFVIEAEVLRMTGEAVATAAVAETRHSTPASAHVEMLWPLDVDPTVDCAST